MTTARRVDVPTQPVPETAPASTEAATVRVSAEPVLRGVAATLSVAVLVQGVRMLVGYRADDAPLSRQLSGLVSYDVWRTLLGVTLALWIVLGVSAAARLRTLPGGLGRSPVLVACCAWLLFVTGLVTLLWHGDGGPDNPLWGARPKVLSVVTAVLVAATPLVVGLWCTRAWLGHLAGELAQADGSPLPVGRRAADLLAVRRIIDGSLRAAALGIGTAVVATGALRNALIELGHETETSWPASWLLLYGGIFTLVFAGVFVPAHLRWDAVADQLVERAVPLPDAGIPADDWHKQRSSLRTVLGREQGFTARLGSGLAITAPLVTSALAAFVPQLAS